MERNSMGIITISREFGSGGREVGKRLADELGYAYYDREIVVAVAERHDMDENFVAYALEGGVTRSYPLHFGRSFSYSPTMMAHETKLLREQNDFLREVAEKGNCVIVGRAADVILADYHPFKLFIYADMEAKLARCHERAEEGERLSDKAMIKKIKQIDKDRKRYHGIITDIPWGDRRGYHLCVNTTGQPIKDVVSLLAGYIRLWQEEQEQKQN